jgi:hypothetical protein
MLEGWAPATFEGLAEWAGDLGFRCETHDYPDGYGGRNQRLTVNGAVSVEFSPWTRLSRRVIVTWGAEAGGEFSRGLPLTALTSLVSALLAVGAGEGTGRG